MQTFTQTYLNRGISQSALSLFRSCPYAFKLRYIDKCIPVFFDPSILDVGGFIHDSIDGYYKKEYLSKPDSYEDILYYSYQQLGKVWDGSFLPEQLSQAYTCLENHSKWEYEQTKKGIATKPFTEQKLSYDGYFGIIDYIYLPKVNVIDWKSGKNAYLSFDYRMQAYVYKVLFEGKFGMKLDKFLFYFLFPNEFRAVTYDTTSQIKVNEETERLKRELIEALESSNFERKPRTERGCNGCSFAYYCEINRKI